MPGAGFKAYGITACTLFLAMFESVEMWRSVFEISSDVFDAGTSLPLLRLSRVGSSRNEL